MEIINNIDKTFKEDMIVTLRSGSKVAIAVSSFSVDAFNPAFNMRPPNEDIDKGIIGIGRCAIIFYT